MTCSVLITSCASTDVCHATTQSSPLRSISLFCLSSRRNLYRSLTKSIKTASPQPKRVKNKLETIPFTSSPHSPTPDTPPSQKELGQQRSPAFRNRARSESPFRRLHSV